MMLCPALSQICPPATTGVAQVWGQADPQLDHKSLFVQALLKCVPPQSQISNRFDIYDSRLCPYSYASKLTLIVLCICFSTEFTFNHVIICEIPCLWRRCFRMFGRCVVSCWGRIPYVQRNRLKLSSCLWSTMF